MTGAGTWEKGKIPSNISVCIYPGTITFARIVAPDAESEPSAAIARVNAITPAFVDAYVDAPIPPFEAWSEETLIMHFGFSAAAVSSSLDCLRCLRRARRVIARQARIVPCRFVLRTCSMSSSFASGRREERETPAALTRISTASYDCG